MSGYSNDLLGKQRAFEPGTELLEKPFTPLARLSKVSRVLHDAEGSRAAGAHLGE